MPLLCYLPLPCHPLQSRSAKQFKIVKQHVLNTIIALKESFQNWFSFTKTRTLRRLSASLSINAALNGLGWILHFTYMPTGSRLLATKLVVTIFRADGVMIFTTNF